MDSKLTLVKPKALAKALEQLVASGQGDALVKMVHNNRKSMKFPVEGINIPGNGPVPYDYIKKNNIHFFRYHEKNRHIVIAYQFERGTGKEHVRYVKYGAVIHRDEMKDGKHEVYDKHGHKRTAINRLMNHGITCVLPFSSMYAFRRDLRKNLVKKGCCNRNATKGSFQLVTENTTDLSLTTNDKSKSSKSKPRKSDALTNFDVTTSK
jgi:hypothetical protein